jgi:hypothetical protein
LRAGNRDVLIGVVCVFRIRDDVRLQLLDDGSMVIDEHGMSGVVDETSEFARHRIAGQQDAGLERLYLKPALTLTFVGLTHPIGPDSMRNTACSRLQGPDR